MTTAPRTEAGRVLRRLWADHNRRVSHGEYPRRDIWDRVTADLLAALDGTDEPAALGRPISSGMIHGVRVGVGRRGKPLIVPEDFA